MFDEYLKRRDLAVLPSEARRPFPPIADRESWLGLPEGVRRELIEWGSEAREGYPELLATHFLEYVRSGDRQAYEKPYFERRYKLIGAALAECVLDDGSFMDAVVDGMWLILEETSWVISAHNVNPHPSARPAVENPLPDPENPYVDLFAAQTGATICWILYFLKGKLDAISPIIARRAKREVERRVIAPFMNRDDFWWMGCVRRDLNNWTPWILSNIVDSMLIIEGDGIRLVQGLKRAMRMMDAYLDSVPADGGCDEGAGYWNMAGAAVLDFLESLHLATGGEADFFGDSLIRAIGDFPVKAHIAGDYYWNFADCDAKPTMDGERMARFGELTDNENLRSLGERTFSRKKSVKPLDTPQMNRVLKSLFHAFSDKSGSAQIVGADSISARASRTPDKAGRYRIAPYEVIDKSGFVDCPNRDIALPRTGVLAWRRGEWYLAVKGGNNAESHNHNDLGSFILYVDGEPQFVDAGNITYTAKTFGPERYEIWNTKSENHSIPRIAHIGQFEGAEYTAQIEAYRDGGADLDLTRAYPLSGLSKYLRGFDITSAGVIIRDEIVLTKPEMVSWVFLLRNEPVLGEGCITSGLIRLEYDSDLTPAVEEIPITDERMKKSFPGSLWRVALISSAALRHERIFKISRS